MKLLLVEDEKRAADYLAQGLRESGYTVDVAHDGVDGLHAAVNGDHDLVILDVMLPGLDGYAVLTALRSTKQTPVLMLTARGQTDDKVRGFDLGADDYLVKPFQYPELLARVRALLKRGQPNSTPDVMRIADLELDPVKHRATRAGQRIDLSAKEFALLALLVRKTARCSRAPRSRPRCGTSTSTLTRTSWKWQSDDFAPRSTTPSRPSCCTRQGESATFWSAVSDARQPKAAAGDAGRRARAGAGDRCPSFCLLHVRAGNAVASRCAPARQGATGAVSTQRNAQRIRSAGQRIPPCGVGHRPGGLAHGGSRACPRPGVCRLQSGSRRIPAAASQRHLADQWSLEWRASRGNGTMLSLAEAGQTKDGRPYELVLTMDRSEDVRVLGELLLTAATVAPLALALVSLSALLIVALGLKPLVTFKKAVEGITARSLKQRVAAQHLPDELRELGLAFNMMLDRLDDAVTRLTQFSDDLAHEMRTPVATLLGRTQVALSRPRTSDELVDVMEGNIEELQRLSRLVSDMLFLARAEHAREALDLQELELAQEARHMAEFLELAAQQREMSITIEGEGRVRGDRGLVQRAITNLLTNALRHGTPGSTVRVTVCTQKEQVTMEVVNRGVPIQPEHMERIFDRFYRTDDSRGRDRGGTGLGLAIVRAIMELHLGSALVATDREKGQVRFSLRFPRGSTPAMRA